MHHLVSAAHFLATHGKYILICTEEVLEFKCLIFGLVAGIKALRNLSESDSLDGTELVGMIVAC